MGIKTFLVKPTLWARLSARRFTFSSDKACPSYNYGHDTDLVFYGFAPITLTARDDGSFTWDTKQRIPEDHEIWNQVAKCKYCGYEFVEGDQKQTFKDRMYAKVSSLTDSVNDLFLSSDGATFYQENNPGYALEVWAQRDLPPGALWFTDWLPKNWEWDNKTDDHLYCKLPDGTDWNIDGRANNCGMKEDRLHRCWVRHGEPPNIHVDKNGLTCNAGAGSIASPGWHGFLHNGELVQC